jgi:two-component system, sensor histidine kinase and response regulator
MPILHFKIAARLTIGLMLLAGLTVVVGAIAFLSFAHLRGDFDQIAKNDLPVIGAASQLSQQAQSIVASAPALVVADSQFTRRTLALRIVDKVTALDEFIKRLKEKGVGGERFEMLTQLRTSLFDNLTTLDHAVEVQLDLNREIKNQLSQLATLDTDLKIFDSPEDEPDSASAVRLQDLLAGKSDKKQLEIFASNLAAQEATARAFHVWRFNAGQTITALLATSNATQPSDLDVMRKEIERRLDIGEWLLTDLPPAVHEKAESWQNTVTGLATGENGLLPSRSQLIDTTRQIQSSLAANKLFADRFDATAARVSSDIEREILDTSGAVSTLTDQQIRLIFGLALLCVLAAVGILVYIRHSVINRLRRLQETMQTHVAGEVAAIDTHGNDEIADMARALEFFVATISEREIALAASESRLRSVTANLPGAVVRLFGRPNGPLVISYISEGVRELIGRSPASLIGVEDGILELMPPGERPSFSAALARAAEQQEQVFFEFRAVNLDDYPGQTTWLRFLSFPRPGEDGELIWDGLILDSTEWKQADMAKRAFVSTVSHELRTPLTSIQGSLGLVAGGAMGVLPDGAKRLVDIANSNCQRLTRLINDILDIEKIEQGHMEFDLKPQALMPLLRQAVEANRGYGLPRGVALKLIEIEPDLEIEVDADRFIQVVNNLVSNAVKYSPDGGQVEVGAERTGTGVRIFISDHGDGIPQGFRERLFARFTQADSSDRRAKGGTGLGLSIAKAIIERFGGEIGF